MRMGSGARPAAAMAECLRASVHGRIPTTVISLCVSWRFRCDVQAVGERRKRCAAYPQNFNGERCEVRRCASIESADQLRRSITVDRCVEHVLFALPGRHAGFPQRTFSIPCLHCRHDSDFMLAWASVSSTYRLIHRCFAPMIALRAHAHARNRLRRHDHRVCSIVAAVLDRSLVSRACRLQKSRPIFLLRHSWQASASVMHRSRRGRVRSAGRTRSSHPALPSTRGVATIRPMRSAQGVSANSHAAAATACHAPPSGASSAATRSTATHWIETNA